jgi:hypothetical protein
MDVAPKVVQRNEKSHCRPVHRTKRQWLFQFFELSVAAFLAQYTNRPATHGQIIPL